MTETTELLVMTAEECFSHLRHQHLGRLAFVDRVGVLPMIEPINYILDGNVVVFRTDPGSKLTAAVLDAPVAFEIDGVDEARHIGWSVVVRGHAEEVTNTAELDHLHQLPLIPWAPGAKSHYVRVQASHVTGRRISLSNLPTHWFG